VSIDGKSLRGTKIANGLHGQRDGTLREAAGRVRKGASAQVIAVLRNLVRNQMMMSLEAI
jgi:hypothetical protein